MLLIPSIVRSMRAAVLVLAAVAGATACSVPFRKSTNERKAECDRLAARAIQTTSLEEAKTLSAQASACYAQLQAR